MKATIKAHWVGQEVLCCEDHVKQLKAVGEALGVHVPIVPYEGEENCKNCESREKRNREKDHGKEQ